MEFNPYQPPQQGFPTQEGPSGRRLYDAVNVVYAAAVVVATALLIVGRRPPLDPDTLLVASYFYAPVVCFAFARHASGRTLSRFHLAYLAYVGFLVIVLIKNLTGAQPDPGMGVLIVGLNAVALLWGLQQGRSRA